jgi:hypothetical protein
MLRPLFKVTIEVANCDLKEANSSLIFSDVTPQAFCSDLTKIDIGPYPMVEASIWDNIGK